MSESVGGGRAEVEQRLLQKSLQDEEFRQRLLADPRTVVEKELETPLPEGIELRAVEETVAGGSTWENTIGGVDVTCGLGCTPSVSGC